MHTSNYYTAAYTGIYRINSDGKLAPAEHKRLESFPEVRISLQSSLKVSIPLLQGSGWDVGLARVQWCLCGVYSKRACIVEEVLKHFLSEFCEGINCRGL